MIVAINPPYGKNCSISKKLIEEILQTYQEVVCLAPIKTNLNQWENLYKIFGPISFYNLWNINRPNDLKLYITYYNIKTGQSFSQSKESYLLSETQYEWYEAVEKYNKIYNLPYTFVQNFNIKNKEKYKDLKEEFIFQIPIYTPANGIGLQGETGEHNLQGKPIKWRTGNLTGPFGVYFNSKIEFDNFSKWYYSCPYSWVATTGHVNCLMDVMLSSLYVLYGTSPSIKKYEEVWPNLDWTRSWTNEEIIQELKDKAGLPKDWSPNL